MTTPYIERQWVCATYAGLGDKKFARGQGSVGVRAGKNGQEDYLELSIGRTNKASSWNSVNAATAWARLTPAKAHELACLLMHFAHSTWDCKGEGIKVGGKHTYGLKVDLEFTVDLCTLISNKDTIKADLMKTIENRLNEIGFPKEPFDVPNK